MKNVEPRPGVHQEDLKHIEVKCFALDDFGPKYRVMSKGIPGGFFARRLVNFIQDDRFIREDREDIPISCNHASMVLSQTRVKSARRSMLAIIAYAYPLFTSMASGKASASTPVHYPHTMALRELYCWLLSAITLSSAAGAFPTRWTSCALQPLASKIRRIAALRKIDQGDLPLTCLKPWSDTVYTWRSQKSFEEPYNIFILDLALLPVARAWIFSFLMSWFTPTVGLGCCSITELSYFMAYSLQSL